jgi:hypothetical protein
LWNWLTGQAEVPSNLAENSVSEMDKHCNVLLNELWFGLFMFVMLDKTCIFYMSFCGRLYLGAS